MVLPKTSDPLAAAPEIVHSLGTYLAVSHHPFPQTEIILNPVQVGSLWFGLRRNLDQWPKALRRQWRTELEWIFNRHELPPTQQKICLCIDVAKCRFKESDASENRQCSRYGNGLCSEATWNATEGKPIPQTILAFFYGMTFRQLRTLQEECIRGWINEILADPLLREYIEHLGLTASS